MPIRDLKAQLIWLCIGVVVGVTIATMALQPAHRRSHNAAQRQLQRGEQDRDSAEEASLELKEEYSALKGNHRALQRRTTGHTVADTPEVVCGKEQAIQEAYVQPGDTDIWTCSGVMGTRRSRQHSKFQQWIVSLPPRPAKGPGIRRAYLDFPLTKHRLPGNNVAGTPTVITAEICQVLKPNAFDDGWEYVLWVSPGSGDPDHARYIIPIGTISDPRREQFVLTNSVPKKLIVENTADVELGRIIRRVSGEDTDDRAVHVLRIHIE